MQAFLFVGAEGIEPSTSVLSGQRSTTELRARRNDGLRAKPCRTSSDGLTTRPRVPYALRTQNGNHNTRKHQECKLFNAHEIPLFCPLGLLAMGKKAE
jgi:hypothetical protein